jgi:aspartate kinase
VIVLKFGGSSVDSAAAIARVAGLVRERLGERPVVVVSAMARTTRRLLESAEAAAAGNLGAATAGCEELHAFHREVGEAAVPPSARARLAALLASTFEELAGLLAEVAAARALSPRAADQAAAQGELLSSEILALALPAHGVPAVWIDCRQVIVTGPEHTRARPCEEATAARLRRAVPPLAARGRVAVVGGYVGATAEGVTTTLGKEGSDVTAALVGAALGAREIQLWTDVPGLLSADPRLVPAARPVRTLSFAEALELACSGAKKPHPGTLGPAARAGVPIRVLSSHEPAAEGTLIGARARAAPAVKSIACRTHAHLLYARPRPGAAAADVLRVAERFRPDLQVLRVGPDCVELAIGPAGFGAGPSSRGSGGVEPAAGQSGLSAAASSLGAGSVEPGAGPSCDEPWAALSQVAELGAVHGRVVVSLVSEDLAANPELLARTLAAAAGLSPRLVTAGAAAPAVRCLVEEEDLPAALALLHGRVFGEAEEVIP